MTETFNPDTSTATTTVALVRDTIRRQPNACALTYKVGKEWTETTWKQIGEQSNAASLALKAAGIAPGDKVAILSENEPKWLLADLAVVTLGAATVGIYPTLPSQQVSFILRNCGAKAIFVQDKKQLAKVMSIQNECPDLATVVVFADADATETVPAFTAFTAPFAGQPELLVAATPDDVAVLIYTSGTTGDPKGAMLTHRNLVSNAKATYKHLVVGDAVVGPDDTFLSFLPLAHSFERMIHLLALAAGSKVVYSHGVRTLMDEMATQKPTIMGCVPRVYESIQEKLMETAAKGPEKNRKLFDETIAVGKKMLEYRQAGKVPGIVTATKHLVLDKLVAEKVRQKFGGQWRFWISGGAALNPDTARFFIALGFNLLEGYGLTETSPVISINPVGKQKVGTVGTVIEGGEILIAADGEICYRGENVMKGYFNNPIATGDMIDSNGWLHTGDIGTYEGGYLKITDRKKDIIVLANGKNVSPSPIEAAIKESPYIQEIVLLGDKQNVCSALVIPNIDRCITWAGEQGVTLADGDALIASPEVKKLIKSEIDKYSNWLADFEKIRRFTLLSTTFSIDGGELTPTMKVKRRVINQKFAAEISALFGDGA